MKDCVLPHPCCSGEFCPPPGVVPGPVHPPCQGQLDPQPAESHGQVLQVGQCLTQLDLFLCGIYVQKTLV